MFVYLQKAPKDKLLIFNVKDGWEPLCKFLGVDIPDVPYPRKNVGGELMAMSMKEDPVMKRMIKETKISLCTLCAMLLPGCYFAYKHFASVTFQSCFS